MPPLPPYLPLILLTLAMLVGVPIAYRAWREAHEEDDPVTDEDVLSGIEAAYFAGEMDEAEYHRVRELLGKGPSPGLKRRPPKETPRITDEPAPAPGDDGAEGPPPAVLPPVDPP